MRRTSPVSRFAWPVVLAMALASSAAAQSDGSGLPAEDAEPSKAQREPTPPPPPPLMGGDEPSRARSPEPANAETRPLDEVVQDNMLYSVGLHAAVNVGLVGLDVHRKRFYGFASGNLGVPLISNGGFGAFSIGVGISALLTGSAEAAWAFDLYGVGLPGWQAGFNFSGSSSMRPFIGIGLGIGFRYLHRSGFTFGLKVPIFGAAVGEGATSGGSGSSSQSLGVFYLAAVVALPLVSFGYRF